MTWNLFCVRRERALRRMAAVFLERPDGQHFGFDLMRGAHISSGAMYPLLARMLVDGWISDGRDTPRAPDRAPRRWYQLTGLGKLECGALLHEAGLWEYVDGELLQRKAAS